MSKWDNGGYVKLSDILPLLNPWKDAEKEFPKDTEEKLLKIKHDDGRIAYSIGYCEPSLHNLWEIFYYPDFSNGWKLIEWMRIPKNEVEE